MAIERNSLGSLKTGLQEGGFSLQEGKLEFLDIFAMVEAGMMEHANYQNAGAPYLVPKLPLAPGQTAPPLVSDAPINPANRGLFVDYRLRPDEAIVMVGKTPPKCTYFGYDADVISRWSEKTGRPVMVFGNYADAINPMVIKTDGPAHDPYQRNTMIIMSADRGVTESIRAAARSAGYPEEMINDYPIPSHVLKLGLDATSDTLSLLIRFAYPEDAQEGQAYLDNPDMKIFRITPDTPPQPAPYQIPDSRVRGSGNFRELELSATAEQLRKAILERYPDLKPSELVTAPFGGGSDGVDGMVGLQEMARLLGPGRDALYLKTDDFTLADDPSEFAIVYGVNHSAIGKTTYNSFSVYGSRRKNGVAAAWNGEYAGTAEEFLPGNPNAKYFYVWKIARHANGDSHTTEVPFNQGLRGVDLDKEMCLGFRLYLEPSTRTGPVADETYFDRVIKFTAK